MGQVIRIRKVDNNNEEIMLVSRAGEVENWLGSILEHGYRFEKAGEYPVEYNGFHWTYRSARNDMVKER